MKIKKRQILPFIGLGIFIYLINKIGINSILNTFREVKIGLIFLALLFLPLIIYLQTLKWDLILRKQGIILPFFYVMKLQIISMFYGSITPAKLGSFIKLVYLKEKTNKSYGEGMSSMLLDRVLDIIVVVGMAAIGSFFLIGEYTNLFYQVIILLVLGIIFLYLISHKIYGKYILMRLYKFLVPGKFKEKFRTSFEDFYKNLVNIKYLFLPFLVGVLTWIVLYTQAYIVGLAFSMEAPYFYFITVFPIATIIGLIPITPGGLGTRELVLVTLLGFVGVSPEIVLSMSVVWFLIGVFFGLFGIYFAVKEKPHNKDEVHSLSQ